jgi:hypothetical protein
MKIYAFRDLHLKVDEVGKAEYRVVRGVRGQVRCRLPTTWRTAAVRGA